MSFRMILPAVLAFTLTFPFDGSAFAGTDQPLAERLKTDPGLAASLHEVQLALTAAGGPVAVIVSLAPDAALGKAVDWADESSRAAHRAAIQDRQEDFLRDLAVVGAPVLRRFENQPGLVCAIDAGALDMLLADPRVAAVELDAIMEPHLNQGIPLMNALATRGAYAGQGVTVAICDTGVDYTHPRLGNGGFPNAKVIGGYDFGSNDADPFPAGNAHGTACAGIAAGALGTVGSYIGGVAPSAKIVALKVTPDHTSTAMSSAIIAAWDWCITHQYDDPANPILIISTSFGGGRFTGVCDGVQTSYATAAANAVAAGITLFVSSGNEGYCDAMASPACLSNTLSVGAVYDAAVGSYGFCLGPDTCVTREPHANCASPEQIAWDATSADKVTVYSNSASFLDLFAPSHNAYTTDIVGASGYSTGDYTTSFGGTSAACPYAAGAAAALQSAARELTGSYLSPADVASKLKSTGNNITDSKVAVTKPRVNLGAAVNTLPTPTPTNTPVASPTPTSPPAGTPTPTPIPSGLSVWSSYR